MILFYYLAGNRTGFTLEKSGETVHNVTYSYDNLNRLSTVSENGAQTVTKAYEYDAFGVEKDPSITDENPFRYCGEYFDKETGTYYLKARYYDPAIGRFTSQDSVRYSERSLPTGNITDPLSLNYYTYSANNPIMYCDPSGNVWETVFDVVSLGLSIAEAVNDPTNGWLWIGVAADAVDLIPFVTGVGEVTRAIRIADNVADTVDNIHDTGKVVDVAHDTAKATDKVVQKGWHVGDDINAPTKSGNAPSWSTVRQRYWKNEAHYHPEDYDSAYLERMRKGQPPLVKGMDNNYYSMELHHKQPRREGGSNNYENLQMVSPWKHAEIDRFRHFTFKEN